MKRKWRQTVDVKFLWDICRVLKYHFLIQKHSLQLVTIFSKCLWCLQMVDNRVEIILTILSFDSRIRMVSLSRENGTCHVFGIMTAFLAFSLGSFLFDSSAIEISRSSTSSIFHDYELSTCEDVINLLFHCHWFSNILTKLFQNILYLFHIFFDAASQLTSVTKMTRPLGT